MKKKSVGKNDLLEADLETAKKLLSTADGCTMLGLEHRPENYKAGNMYLSALREILRLRDELSNQNDA